MSKLKIFYCADARLPTEKAHGWQIVKTCSALAAAGVDLTILVPTKANPIKQNIFAYYSLIENFKIEYLLVPHLSRLGQLGYWLQSIVFSFAIWRQVRKERGVVVYSRDILPALAARLAGHPAFWEAHDSHSRLLERFALRYLTGVASISQGLKDFLVSDLTQFRDRVVVVPDAVDLKPFQKIEDKGTCRRLIGFEGSQFLIVYTGHLYGWKGVDTLAETSRFLPDGYMVMIVGGTESDLIFFKNKYKNLPRLLIVGRKPNREIPHYLRAADILVLPNSGRQKISTHFTSPLKLFEYLASGTPIIASDLPSLREILSEDNSVLVPADDPEVLARAIISLSVDQELKTRIGQKAKMLAEEFSWDKRAQRIIDLVWPKKL